MTGRLVRCRYLRRCGQQCTAEAAEPAGEILLCTRHLGEALALVRAQRRQALHRTIGRVERP